MLNYIYDLTCELPVIDLACNGTFVMLNDYTWHRLLVKDGRCFNHDKDVLPGKGELVIDTNDAVHDQWIITRKAYPIEWIRSLSVNTFCCDWS